MNELFGMSISSEAEMQKWINDRKPVPVSGSDPDFPANGEEMSVARVGTDLYEKVTSVVAFAIVLTNVEH